jgi:hypothetical protein
MKPIKMRSKRIVINTQRSEYPIIDQVAEQLGWRVSKDPTSDYDLLWTDLAAESAILSKLKVY